MVEILIHVGAPLQIQLAVGFTMSGAGTRNQSRILISIAHWPGEVHLHIGCNAHSDIFVGLYRDFSVSDDFDIILEDICAYHLLALQEITLDCRCDAPSLSLLESHDIAPSILRSLDSDDLNAWHISADVLQQKG